MSDLDDLVDEWTLRPDGPAVRSDVLPVIADGVPAVLKVGAHEHEHLALRRWNGDGAVRLLRADPHRRAVLVERLGTESLDGQWDIDACTVVAGLYARLHVPAMPQLPTLATMLVTWADELRALPRSAPIPRRMVEQVVTLCGELAAAPNDVVLHGNLHYGNMLAADREPWLAISPRPVNGDPHFELAPMLWTRWDELADAVRWGVRYRLSTLVDAAGLDEDLARAWVLVRVIRAAAVATDPAAVTRYVTLAKAVQD